MGLESMMKKVGEGRFLEILKKLTEREEKVLRLRMGILDGKKYSLEEIGLEFGLTRERIRQIEAKAARKLKFLIEIEENEQS